MEEHTQINYADEAFISITSANRDGILLSISRDIIIDNFYGDEEIISSIADEDSGKMLDANLDNCVNVLYEFLRASCEISVADFPWRAEETLQALVS